jgi:hypothetical protein
VMAQGLSTLRPNRARSQRSGQRGFPTAKRLPRAVLSGTMLDNNREERQQPKIKGESAWRLSALVVVRP